MTVRRCPVSLAAGKWYKGKIDGINRDGTFVIAYDDGDKEPVIAALTDCAGNDSSQEVRNAALSALKMVAHEPAGK